MKKFEFPKITEVDKDRAGKLCFKSTLEHYGVEKEDTLIIQGDGAKAQDIVDAIESAINDKKLFIVENIDKVEN